MPDWRHFIRGHLAPLTLGAERELEIIEELSQHLEAAYEDALRDGASEHDALKRATAQIPDWRLLECELSRDQRPIARQPATANSKSHEKGWILMETLRRDLLYGWRMLLRNPAVTALAVIALALGIGANTAIFTLVNAVLLFPLPYDQPERLVMLWEDDTLEGNGRNPVAPANLADWRKQNEVCTDLAYYSQPGGLNVTGDGEPERIIGAGVSANMLSVLGVQPILGTSFHPIDGEVILSYGLWQRRFGGDPSVQGKTMRLDGTPFTVVGVMPQHFQLPEDSEIWYQTRNGEQQTRSQHFLRVLGRLKAGVTQGKAQASFNTIARRLEQEYPETNKGRGINLVSVRDQFVGDVRRALLVLLAAVGFVLLIACANVANLLLVRAAARQREMAIRAALGADRFNLTRQLLIESVMLAIAGGAAGLLLARLGVDVLAKISPAGAIHQPRLGLNLAVLAFTFVVTLLTGIACGLAPAWQAAKLNPNDVLKEGGRASVDNPGRRRTRELLVVSEIALAMLLLVGAGLTIKSFSRLMSVEPGFDPANLLTIQMSLSGSKYDGPQIVAGYRQILERISALPGVRSAGAISRIPLAGDRSTSSMLIEGREVRPGEQAEVHYRITTPGYFSAMGIPLRAGRPFTESDNNLAPGVALINESAVRKHWSSQDPIGKRIRLGPNAKAPWTTIVGVVGDARNFGLDGEARPEVYVSYLQNPSERMRLVIRTETQPASLVPGIREAVRQADPDLPLFQVMTMEDLYAKSVAQRRLNVWLLGVFAVVALLLAVTGIYGVMSYSVTQRRHEIGIRMALGAQAGNVLVQVLREGMKLASIGITIGLVASIASTRLLQTLLFGVSATDPATLAAVAMVLATVALLACYVPARRATRVDPLTAIRYE